MWPFKRKKNEPILIKDGKIIVVEKPEIDQADITTKNCSSSPEKITPHEKRSSSDKPPKSRPKYVALKRVIPTSDNKNISSDFNENLPTPLTGTIPSLFTNPESGDLGLFLHFLESSGYKPRTVQEYMIDLRIWQKELGGIFPDSEMISRMVDNLSAHRGHRMLTSLKKYAHYRNLHGDPRLVILFATSQQIKSPKIIKKAKRKPLPKDQLKLYKVSAKELCKEQNRAGVWMGLSLYGIKLTDFSHVSVEKDKIIILDNGNSKKIKAPQWLCRAINDIDKSKWLLSGNAIRKGMRKYGITPHTLYISSVAALNSRKSGNC